MIWDFVSGQLIIPITRKKPKMFIQQRIIFFISLYPFSSFTPPLLVVESQGLSGPLELSNSPKEGNKVFSLLPWMGEERMDSQDWVKRVMWSSFPERVPGVFEPTPEQVLEGLRTERVQPL
jgi:hypothetical protein